MPLFAMPSGVERGRLRRCWLNPSRPQAGCYQAIARTCKASPRRRLGLPMQRMLLCTQCRGVNVRVVASGGLNYARFIVIYQRGPAGQGFSRLHPAKQLGLRRRG